MKEKDEFWKELEAMERDPKFMKAVDEFVKLTTD